MAVVLATVTGSDGIVRCFYGNPEQPGLIFEPKALTPIVEQIASELRYLHNDGIASLGFQVRSDHSDEFMLADGTMGTIYIAAAATQLDSFDSLKGSWVSIPELLRSMPKSRQRLVYLRAWQVLLGGLTDGTKAVDLEEAMKHLKNSTIKESH